MKVELYKVMLLPCPKNFIEAAYIWSHACSPFVGFTVFLNGSVSSQILYDGQLMAAILLFVAI